MVIEVGHNGPMLTLLPMTSSSKVKEVIHGAGAILDKRIGRYVLRATNIAELVKAATDYRVELRPGSTLKAYLLATAAQLRAAQNYVDSAGKDLYPYQLDGVAFLWQNHAAILADDMGLGKTVQALKAVPAKAPVLVVCPGFLATNWECESKRWQPAFGVSVVKTAKEFCWPKPGRIVVSSYGKLPATPDKFGRPEPGTHIIADEAQYLKSWKAARTRNFRKLQRRAAKNDGMTWLLTGTPILNRPNELWALLQALQLGKTCYGSYDNFVKVFGGVKDGLGITTWTGKVKDDAMEPVKPYILRRTKAQVLPDLPPKTRRSLIVSPPDTHLRLALDEVLADYSEVLDKAVDGWEMSNEVWQGLSTARKALAAAKVTDLLLLLPQYEDAGEAVVVFSAHRAPAEALEGRPGWATIIGGMTQAKRDENVKALQDGRLKGLACTIGAAGLGLTLTAAAHAIFVDLDYVPASNLQAEDRLCRIGQTRGVQITRLVCDHKLDHMMTRILEGKLALLDKTTENLNAPQIAPKRLNTASQLESIAATISD